MKTRYLILLSIFAAVLLTPLGHAQAPVFVITQDDSTVKFSVSASVDDCRQI